MARPPDPSCWLHPDVVIDTSPIAGRGLFAAAPLASGTVVSRLGGRLVSGAELQESFRGPGYVDSIVVDEDVHLVLPPGTPNHFGNHSCDPNLGWAGEYTLVATRDLAAGTELTSDYATSTANPEFVLRCHCETYRCRGIVAGDDWQIPQLQRRYAGYWVPMLRRRIDEAARVLDGPPAGPSSVRVCVVDGAATRELRRAVLRPGWPAGSPMHGEDNPDAVHLAALSADGAVLGACLVLPRRYPLRPDAPDAWQLRGMASADGQRGRGIGAQVLAAALAQVADRGARLLWCEARTSAVGFYVQHGLAVEGAEYLHAETGIPHHYMWRAVAAGGDPETAARRRRGESPA